MNGSNRPEAEMAQHPDVIDSPRGWVAEHTKRYLETGGVDGHEWRGALTLLLTVKGRRTGTLHRTALIYGRDGERYLLVASYGGNPKHPVWYLNLVANPEVEVQVMSKVLRARARTARDEEWSRLWPIMTAVWPAYDEYQTKPTRQIPLIILDPIA